MWHVCCTILVVVNRLSRPVVVLDGLPGLYGFKYDSASACGLPLYLYSYKLVSSATLFVAQLCDLGFKYIFGVDDIEIISVDGSNLIFKGFRYENLYLVDFVTPSVLQCTIFAKALHEHHTCLYMCVIWSIN